MTRVGVFEIILFFVCLNLACYFLNEIEAIPYALEGIETPETIMEQTSLQLFSSIAVVISGTFAGFIVGSIVAGASIALVLAAIMYVLPILQWVFFGFPNVLLFMGVPSVITTVIQVLIGVVFFWFLIGLIAQRYME